MEFYALVKKNTYHDSMKLMQLQSILETIPGIISCGIAMATPANKETFRDAGLVSPQIEEAGPNDLCIAIRAENKEALSSGVEEIQKYFLAKRPVSGFFGQERVLPKSISSALRRLPDSNLAIISVPGQHAAWEARKALSQGLHVFLFSDNVLLEDEVELKELASEKGLLLMGPDCGTAVIGGVPLGFSNVIRRGRIGLIGASGSGMQEVCCLIHRMGEGISQAIGTGGRDLSKEVGGKTFIMALEALLEDQETEVLVLMSKHCDERAAQGVVERTKESRKPVVAFFPSTRFLNEGKQGNVYPAANLEHIAALTVALVRGEKIPLPLTRDGAEEAMKFLIGRESPRFSPEQKYLRAFFAGGTLADEANEILPCLLNRVYSFPASERAIFLENPRASKEHCIIDMGDDAFTKGKLHPIIDPSLRNERILKEAQEGNIRVFLLDVFLGYGAHPDPGTGLARTIVEAKKAYTKKGKSLCFVVSLTGTEGDPQNYNAQKRRMEEVGAIVMESSTRATYLAGLIAAEKRNTYRGVLSE
ncbi:MAG TPA: acyl-CoA synthetase FdrA [Thermodesulfobacteriota bacterium]|nr:acyl-CoA synthetase FdrA [Thermodesulfobacteriota bacterium]